MRRSSWFSVSILGGLLALGANAATPLTAPTNAGAERLDLRLTPATGLLEGVAWLSLPAGLAATEVEIELLEKLQIDAARSIDGAQLELEPIETATDRPRDDASSGSPGDAGAVEAVRRYRLRLADDAEAPAELEIRYHGVLREDWRAGEQAGEIHNFSVDAHIGEEGIYLSGETPWYPRPRVSAAAAGSAAVNAGAADAEPLFLDVEVTLRGVPGMLLVASGNRLGDGPREPGADEVWRTPFPLPEMSVAGGPLRAFRRRVGGVEVFAHLSEANAPFADTLLDALSSYLELYQPLIGPYPFREFTVVENFFSSGFAFPGFTLIASQVLQMREGSLRPGYLDHELTHAWWGNGVLGAAGRGIWSEALASYSANLMRPVLEGDDEAARAQRRSILEGLSRTSPDGDKPLATFGLEHGASRFIGYQKGSLVFAQLARTVGQERMWYALRTLVATRLGRPTTWDDLQTTFERASGRDLEPFFDYWVRGSGLPDLSPRSVEWRGAAGNRGELRAELSGPLSVAISRLELGLIGRNGTARREVDLVAGATAIVLDTAERPSAIEIDPDFTTARRLPPAIWMPTISGLEPTFPLQVVRATGEAEALDAKYQPLVDQLHERYAHHGELAEVRWQMTPGERLPPAPKGHLMFVGAAAGSNAATDLLSPARLRIDPQAHRFELEGEEYADPAQAVLGCVSRPEQPGAEACAYWGNSSAALERSYLVTFYGGDSLLVFDQGRPTLRRRFAPAERVAVTSVRPE